MRKKCISFLAVLCAAVLLCGCSLADAGYGTVFETEAAAETGLPVYTGSPYVELDNGMPAFSDTEKTNTEPFERYSKLDALGRCGTAYANICPALMPTEERGDIGQVKPSGWHTVKYPGIIEDNYLYNRCHLIGFQLAGENANEKNLITGTRYLNIEGMLPFENQVAEYVRATENHVLYRVTPVFAGDDLVASGVELEGWSVEDGGSGICFHVYCFNVQPGIEIDYADGESRAVQETAGSAEEEETADTGAESASGTYVLNTHTMRIHLPDCADAERIEEANKETYTGTIRELKEEGYVPCGNCLSAYRD